MSNECKYLKMTKIIMMRVTKGILTLQLILLMYISNYLNRKLLILEWTVNYETFDLLLWRIRFKVVWSIWEIRKLEIQQFLNYFLRDSLKFWRNAWFSCEKKIPSQLKAIQVFCKPINIIRTVVYKFNISLFNYRSHLI